MQLVLKRTVSVVTLPSIVSSRWKGFQENIQERLVSFSLLYLTAYQRSPIYSKLGLILEGVYNGLIWNVEGCEQEGVYGPGIESVPNTINRVQLTDMALPHLDWASEEHELSSPRRAYFLPLPLPNVRIHSAHT